MESKGWSIRIVWGVRTKAENDALVEKKLASPSSKHLKGRAVDLVDRQTGYSNDRNHKFYKDLSAIAKRLNLRWGGDFSSRWDPCHIEMR